MTTENQAPEGALRAAFESWALHTPPDERTNWEVFQAGARAALAAPAPQAARDPVAFVHWPQSGPPRLVWYSNKELYAAIAAKRHNDHVPDLLLYPAAPQTKEPTNE